MIVKTKGKYILDGHTPVECDDLFKWGEWFQNTDRTVKKDWIRTEKSVPIQVSTVFLGIDHSWTGKGPPVVFETMVFGGRADQYCVRYSSWDEAIHGHIEVIKHVMRAEIASSPLLEPSPS